MFSLVESDLSESLSPLASPLLASDKIFTGVIVPDELALSRLSLFPNDVEVL